MPSIARQYKRRAPNVKRSPGRPHRHRKVFHDNMSRLSKSQIQRLARKAGVMCIDGRLYDEVRAWIKIEVLTPFIIDAVIYTEHMRCQTITSDIMLHAWQRRFGREYGADVAAKSTTACSRRGP
jgi:histone H3/H4